MTRRDTSTPWFIPTEDYFTEDEWSNIVIPYRAMVESTPGFIGRTSVNLDDFKYTLIIQYDTLENAQSAIWEITGHITGHIGETYRLLAQTKKQELGINYIVNTAIEE